MLRKLLLTGALVMFGDSSLPQIVIGLLISLFYLMLVLKLMPFEDVRDDHLNLLTSLQIYLALLAGVLLVAEEYSSDNSEARPGFTTQFLYFNKQFLFLFSIITGA